MALVSEEPRPDRAHVDPNDDAVIRHLRKISGKSREDVLAAIKKVGTNIESLKKELGCVAS
jgi:hypothetical protein